MQFTYEKLQEMAAVIRSRLRETPRYGLVLGTTLGPLAEEVEDAVRIPYAEIPGMLHSTAPGHAGMYVAGRLQGKAVLCMSGRFHYYEGYDFEELTLPVRLFKLLGVETQILTNAAGCVNTDWQPGDVMLIRDHINMMGASPLRGPNMAEFGPRFFDCGNVYDRDLRALARRAAAAVGEAEHLHEGVYFFMPGPGYETPAEIRAIHSLGGDATGMSTITESLTAAHCGIRTLALSLLTNMAAGLSDAILSEEDVEAGARLAGSRMRDIVREVMRELP